MLRLLALRSFVVVLLLLLASAAAQQGAASPPAPSPAAAPDPAHDPALEALLARLAERPADVGKAIAAVPSLAARARLQAAFGPLRLRPMAMLAVARAFPGDPEADLALLAAAAALLVHQGRGDAVPELAQWSDEIDDERTYLASQQAALLPTVVAVRQEIDARRAAGGDAAVLDEAAALLAIASVSRGGGAAVQLRCNAAFQVPADLGEPIELAFHPRELPAYGGSWSDRHRLNWGELRTLGEPLQRTLLTPRRAVATAPVPPGDYLLAVRSQATPWWGVVPIEVSDLEALAVLEDEAVAVAAWAEGRAVAAPFELTGGAQAQRGRLAGGPQVVALDANARERGYAYDLRLHSEFGPARLLGTIPGPERYAVDERWLVHSMLERSLCRPGDTIAGRIVLRRCTREGLGRARVPTTTVAGDCAVRVRFRFGDAGEVVCAGRTDTHGLFAFEVAVPETATPVSSVAADVEVPDVDADGAPLRVAMPTTFAIAHFVLAATTLDTEGPNVRPEHDECEIAAVVRYASGAPAAGQLVQAEVEGHTTALRTGADGRAVLRLSIAAWDAWRAQQRARGQRRSHERQVEFSLLGPDGQPQQRTHVVHDHEPTAAAAKAASRSWGALRDEPRIDLAPAVVGRPTRIVVHGAAGAHALLVVGRSRNARAFALQFDERGHAAQTVDVLRTDWPRLDIALVDRDTLVRDDTFVTLAPVVPAAIELPSTAAPGSDVPCRVRTGRPGALVTLAVVDERVFAVEAERTREPTAALRPSAPAADWQRMARAARAEPADVLAAMLVHGRVPPLDWQTFGQGSPASGCGGPGVGSGGAPALRADFRTVAHFGTVVADGDGLATFVVRLPSDLTTWRATAAVVDANGEGGLATAATSTRMPWSVEPVLPRGLRAGDTFELPLVVAHDATIADQPAAVVVGTAAATALEVVVRAEAEQLVAARDVVAVTVPRGGARAVTVPMRAVAIGDAGLGLELRGPLALDRSQRQVAIERDAVVRSRVVAQRGSGKMRVPLPVAATAEDALVVEVLLGNAAVWNQLEQDLATYPYGCAEQTLAKLLPYFAVARARARASRGDALPALDEAGQRRLRAGLSRLRQLRAGAARFSFWPGGDADRAISVLVKHGLAVLREAGVDLAHERLDVAGAFVLPTMPADGADEATWAVFAMAIEEAAATLRLAPAAERARQLAAVALPALDGVTTGAGERVRFALSAGTAARLGLALLAAGDRDGARVCLARLDRGAAASEVAVTDAGEDPMAVAAMQLELRLSLDTDAAAIEAAVAELELACVARSGSTYGQACAAAALALVLARTDVRTADVEVEVAGERRSLHLTSDGGALGRLQFPRAGEVVVRGPDGAVLLVRVTSVHTQRGSDHAAWRQPITVERSLHALPVGLDTAARERVLRAELGDAMPRLAGPLPAGRPVLLVVRTTSPVAMQHVVVECPLPCGFELAGDARGVERFPSHVAFVADLRAGEPFERRLLLVPTMVGRFAWPPTTATPMYAADRDGGTAGASIEVVAPPPGTEPVLCLWQPPVLLEPDAAASSRAAELAARRARFDALRAWWDQTDDGEPADAEQAARRTAALGFDPATADPFAALAALDDWLDEGAFWGWPRGERGGARRGARRAVQLDEWLRARLLAAFAEAMRCPMPRDAEQAAAQIEVCDRALQQLPDEDDVVPRRMSLLARAMASAPDMVRQVLQGMPADPQVAEQWSGYRELLHAALVHAEAEVRSDALARLSPSQRAELPVAVLLRAPVDPWEPELVRQLVANEAQAAAFELALHDPDLVHEHERALRLALPSAWWLRLPLRVFERLADHAYSDACDDAWHVPMLGDLVARSRATDAELVQALGETTDSRYRGVLSIALRARGVRAVGSARRADDDTFAAWAQALALAADDAAGALALLKEHLAGNGAISAHEPSASLGRFLRQTVVEHGTPMQVHAIARALDDDSWTRLWARLATAERVQLVDRFLHELPDAFVPATLAEAEAIWRCMLRNESVDSTMANLTATAAGVQCARRHVEAGDGGELAADARAAFAEALGLAAATLLPSPGEEGDAMLATLRRFGAAAAGSPGECAWLHRLRRQLGASLPRR